VTHPRHSAPASNELCLAFGLTARAYVEWVRDGIDAGLPAVQTALLLVTDLYAAGLRLPNPEAVLDLSPIATPARATLSQHSLLKSLGSRIPFQYYQTVVNPFDLLKDPTNGIGDIIDDLVDIHGDVSDGLALLDAGHEPHALFSWAESFRIHWGTHAAWAIGALHDYRRTGRP
jgi:hypothetical protein